MRGLCMVFSRRDRALPVRSSRCFNGWVMGQISKWQTSHWKCAVRSPVQKHPARQDVRRFQCHDIGCRQFPVKVRHQPVGLAHVADILPCKVIAPCTRCGAEGSLRRGSTEVFAVRIVGAAGRPYPGSRAFQPARAAPTLLPAKHTRSAQPAGWKARDPGFATAPPHPPSSPAVAVQSPPHGHGG